MAEFRLNLHDFFLYFVIISWIRLAPNGNSPCLRHCRATQIGWTREHAAQTIGSLSPRGQRMRRGSGGLAIGTELRLLASSSVTRFPLHPRVCPLFPASLTSLLDGHASLCLPWNAIQTAKQPGIETTWLYGGAGSNYSDQPTWNSLSQFSCNFSSSAAHP